MRKFLVLMFAMALAGCAQLTALTTSIQNPVGNNTLAGAISTYGILDSAVIAYRGLPRCTKTDNFSATNICYKRSVLVQAQAYDKAANAAINNAVEFQRSNPTLDATSYVNIAIASVNTFKDFAKASQLPGVQ
jgi:hypothetical protein